MSAYKPTILDVVAAARSVAHWPVSEKRELVSFLLNQIADQDRSLHDRYMRLSIIVDPGADDDAEADPYRAAIDNVSA